MHNRCLLLAALTLAAAVPARGGDWVTAPSYFTHSPQTGERVQQYAPVGPFYSAATGTLRRGGFHHTRSSIQVGGSADHYHLVEEFGPPVRPYGEWRFPYRPYSVPYPAWGSPYGHGYAPGFGFGYGHGHGHGFGHRGHPGPSRGRVVPPYPGYHPKPHDDGRYPPYDSNGPYGYPDLRFPQPTPKADSD